MVERNGHPRAADDPPLGAGRPPAGPNLRLLLGLFLLVLLLPVATALIAFPLLSTSSVESVTDLSPANVEAVRVYLLNRAELNRSEDKGPDVGPFWAAAADIPGVLAPLMEAQEVPEFSGVRGPWFGEYQVRTTDGRNGTIKLYWSKVPGSKPDTPERLRFQIKEKRYEGGSVGAVLAAATAAEPRGRSGR